MTAHADIRVGIGGWTYAPWRQTFYPQGLRQKRELEYASRAFTAIEINGTFHRTQSAASFAKWREQTPDDFMFSVKASRYTTQRRVLAEAGESVAHFLGSGLAELGPKLGPILWQFAPSKRFDPDDFERFLQLLPDTLEGLPLRHVLEVRHESFVDAAFIALARRHKLATVFTDSAQHPSFADVSADFVYARLVCAQASIETGYAAADLDAWASRSRDWAQGRAPADLSYIEKKQSPKARAPREVFVFFINGAKERAPAAAQALLKRLA